ncbi:hypothetical protein [Thermococcus barophilus]|uniref:Uncharacterized protein n=1 Tax=Thermococcus barophilus TaxID=55802 RepID=A0A0S1XEH0_THEBA|nr:hypothetical protein [Thermococcus barophilus]ALM76207.1 conserved membrane hypothetical protein [Thermococcus barophilus]
MNTKSAVQLLIFVLIAGFFAKTAWGMITKEAAFFGAILGITMHWLLTNKGNKNVVYIKPLSAGWRVLIYDILLCTWLIALYQQAGSFSALFDALKNNVQNLALLLALLGGIGIDYSVGG